MRFVRHICQSGEIDAVRQQVRRGAHVPELVTQRLADRDDLVGLAHQFDFHAP